MDTSNAKDKKRTIQGTLISKSVCTLHRLAILKLPWMLTGIEK